MFKFPGLILLLSGLAAGSAGAQETKSKSAWGKMGKDNWAALYEAYATSWNNEQGNSFAAQHLNRYDLVMFGKKFSGVAGHGVTTTKSGMGEPKVDWELKILGKSVFVAKSYLQTFPLISATTQIWIGYVPVLLQASAAGSFGVSGGATFGEVVSAQAEAHAGVGVQVTAAVGFAFGYVGVEGMLNLIQAEVWLNAGLVDQKFSVKSGFNLSTSGVVSLVAKIGPLKKSYPIYEPPGKNWYTKVLLNVN